VSDEVIEYVPADDDERQRQLAWQQWHEERQRQLAWQWHHYWEQQAAARRRRNTMIAAGAGAAGTGVLGAGAMGIGMAILLGIAAVFGVFVLGCLLFLIILI
jgi:hypothetical protein